MKTVTVVYMGEADLRKVVREEVEAVLAGHAPEPELISTRELAAKLGVNAKTVSAWASEGAPHVKAGKGFRWRLRDVLAWLATRKQR